MSTPNQVLLERLQSVIGAALDAGKVVTIELKPLEPLAMGNYIMVPAVRDNLTSMRARGLHTLLYRVLRASNFDNPMIDDEWASSSMTLAEAEVVCDKLNERLSEKGRYWHSVVPATHTLYKFEP